MARRALISDIHSNLAALEAVLRDCEAQKVDAIYCLGDIVGYGPMPEECLRRVMSVVTPGRAIKGNHDHAVLTEPIGFTRSAREAVLWTSEVLRPRFFHIGGRRSRWNWLKSLPTMFTEDDVTFVHASPRQHMEEYLLEENTTGISLTGEDPQRLLDENFSLIEHTCFIGHTHRPGVITCEDFQWHSLASMANRWTITQDKAIINIGSVGQPRDFDARACYVIFDGESVEWRRVEYDIELTRRLILDNPRLENRSGDRLKEGR